MDSVERFGEIYEKQGSREMFCFCTLFDTSHAADFSIENKDADAEDLGLLSGLLRLILDDRS